MDVITTISTRVDFSRPGKQIGTLNLPYSPDDDAYGYISIPIAVIANGEGPTVVMTGGVHGDEYEGPVVLGDLIRSTKPEQVRGRLIIVPCANAPAVRAGTRTSPVDRRNMAREFPGDHFGSVTQQITAYIHSVLFPLANYYMDLHAGGKSLIIEHSALVFPTEHTDDRLRSAAEEMARVFGAPLTVVASAIGHGRTPCASALARGIPCISVEMGIAGWISPDGVKLCREGVQRVLKMTGVLPDANPPAPGPSRLTRVEGPESYVICPEDGYFEPAFKLMDRVQKGQVAGRVHHLLRPEVEPTTLHFLADGWVWSHRTWGDARAGGALAVLVESVR